jgi:hypothetical protein
MNRTVKIGPELPACAVARCVGTGRHAFLAAALAALFFMPSVRSAHAQGDISNIITDTVTRNVTGNIGRNLEATPPPT